MGCVNTKRDINELHPNIFNVANVDDQGEYISSGQLEVTETELILYQKGKSPTIWPLRTLRKYGFDSEIFSFECGRRCPTGHGIYAFKCRKAEQLFNLVQHLISRNMSDDNPLNSFSSNGNDFPVPVGSTGPVVHRILPSQTQNDGYLNPVAPPPIRSHPSVSRPGSISSNGPMLPSNGPLSPPPLQSPLPLEMALEHNNNKRGSLIPEHSYTNTTILPTVLDTNVNAQASYANVAPILSASSPEAYVNLAETGGNHVYMNIDTKEIAVLYSNTNNFIAKDNQMDQVVVEETIDEKHCYANIDAKDIELVRPLRPSYEPPLYGSAQPTPNNLYITVHEVNYAKLDFDPKAPQTNGVAQGAQQSVENGRKGYATIDFRKTNALSQSTNPSKETEEGSRKTRHNSTISEVTNTRNSNSLSD